MNPGYLLDRLHRAGATLAVVDGKTRIRGAMIPAGLLEDLKLNRSAVLAELERRQAEDRHRYGQVPPADAPLLAATMNLPEESKKHLLAYVHRQLRPVHAWVMARANHYFEQGQKADECEWRACVDLVVWQRGTSAERAISFVLDLPSNC